MVGRGIGRLRRRLARHRRNSHEPSALILAYHQVAELRSDPWALSVTPRRFAEHLEVLREHTHPIRLQQLSQALLQGNLPDRSVTVTFDDGYADNLHNAKPMLERYGIPATVFVVTGYTGREREFWWDELDRLLLQPGTLPAALSLSLDGGAYRWELGGATHYGEEASRRYQGWRAWEEAPSLRHALYSSLWELLQPLTEGEQQLLLGQLLAWTGAEPAGRSTHRCLSLDEVAALTQGKLVEVGAHTVTHPALSTLPAASQWDEILKSKAWLEEVLGSPVDTFAYPYGKQPDYTAETVSIVREAGFSCACSNFAGVVERSSDPFQLPRIHVQDWDGDEFARRLFRWFGG
jgi:peptidoglycan/xylan/chitin deacetylase (PgdA/CDA1 family)